MSGDRPTKRQNTLNSAQTESNKTVKDSQIPTIFDGDDMAHWFIGRPWTVTKRNVTDAIANIGRNQGCALIFDLYFHGPLKSRPAVLAHGLAHAWCGAEYPEDAIEDGLWFRLFRAAGYAVDGKREAPTPDPIRLYRGAPESRKRRMAWTSDIDVARTFAHEELRGRDQGKLWTALVPPFALLAQMNDREESEYVVDPRQLEITEYDSTTPMEIDA